MRTEREVDGNWDRKEWKLGEMEMGTGGEGDGN